MGCQPRMSKFLLCFFHMKKTILYYTRKMTFWHFNFAFFIALNCFYSAYRNHIIKQYGKRNCSWLRVVVHYTTSDHICKTGAWNFICNVGLNSPWEWKGRVTRKDGGWRHAAVAAISLPFCAVVAGSNYCPWLRWGRRDGHCWRNYTDKSKPCDRHASKGVLYTEGPIAQDFFRYRFCLNPVWRNSIDDAFFTNMCAPWTSAMSLLTD